MLWLYSNKWCFLIESMKKFSKKFIFHTTFMEILGIILLQAVKREGRLQYLMEMKDMQLEVDTWISQFEEGYWHPLSMLARLSEEVGELAREINHLYGEKPKKVIEDEGNLAMEMADILFILCCMANSMEISLEDAFKQMMEKYQRRDADRWTRKISED